MADDREIPIEDLIETGKSTAIEFKATLRTNLYTKQKDFRIEFAVLKAIAGFPNTGGDSLFVGVSDGGRAYGLEIDEFPNEDKMSLHFVNIVKQYMDPQTMTFIHPRFEDFEDQRVMVVECQKSPVPIFKGWQNRAVLYPYRPGHL